MFHPETSQKFIWVKVHMAAAVPEKAKFIVRRRNQYGSKKPLRSRSRTSYMKIKVNRNDQQDSLNMHSVGF